MQSHVLWDQYFAWVLEILEKASVNEKYATEYHFDDL